MARSYVVWIMAGLTLVAWPVGSAQAEVLQFSLQPGNSILTLSGSATLGDPVNNTFQYATQGPNSLSTSYTGTITVDVTNPSNPTSIAFQSAALDASTNGNWFPPDGGGAAAPAAPGDYGVSINEIGANARLSNVVFGLSGAATPVTAGSFSVASQGYSFANGDLDVFSTALDAGNSIALTGTGLNTAVGTATYSVLGNIATLSIPVEFTIPYDFGPASTPTVDGRQTFSGLLVATAAVPEPSSFAVLGLLAAVGCFARRRLQKTIATEPN